MSQKKELKVKRHCERLFECFNPTSFERLPRRVLKEETVYDDKVKRYVRKTLYCNVDRHAEMKNYRFHDFCMDNLNAIGAKLKPVVMSSSSDMANQQVLDYVSSVESALKQNESNK